MSSAHYYLERLIAIANCRLLNITHTFYIYSVPGTTNACQVFTYKYSFILHCINAFIRETTPNGF